MIQLNQLIQRAHFGVQAGRSMEKFSFGLNFIVAAAIISSSMRSPCPVKRAPRPRRQLLRSPLDGDGSELIAELLAFEFDGLDLGTGLDGEFYLLTEGGRLSLIDESSELIYQSGMEFFDESYPRLAALTHDALLAPRLRFTTATSSSSA